jgi:hypothetical protein
VVQAASRVRIPLAPGFLSTPHHRCARRRHAASLQVSDAKYRYLIRNCGEVVQWRAAIHPNVRARPRSERKIALEDRRSFRGRDQSQFDGLSRTSPKNRPPVRCLDVPNPVSTLAKHRDQISCAVPVSNDDRERNNATASPSHDLESGGAPWSHPNAEDHCPRTVHQAHNRCTAASFICPAQVRVAPAHHTRMRGNSAGDRGVRVIRRPAPPTVDCPLPGSSRAIPRRQQDSECRQGRARPGSRYSIHPAAA